MTLEDLNNCTTVITYDDENYGKRVFINGKFITYIEDGTTAIVRLLNEGQTIPVSKPIIDTGLNFNELFFGDIDREIGQKVHSILSENLNLTEEQVLAIFNSDYEKII